MICRFTRLIMTNIIENTKSSGNWHSRLGFTSAVLIKPIILQMWTRQDCKQDTQFHLFKWEFTSSESSTAIIKVTKFGLKLLMFYEAPILLGDLWFRSEKGSQRVLYTCLQTWRMKVHCDYHFVDFHVYIL